MKLLLRALLCCVLATGAWAQRGGGGRGGGGHFGGGISGGFRGGGGFGRGFTGGGFGRGFGGGFGRGFDGFGRASAVLTASEDLGEDSGSSGPDSTGILPLASDLILSSTATDILSSTATDILSTDPATPAITARALTVGIRIRT